MSSEGWGWLKHVLADAKKSNKERNETNQSGLSAKIRNDMSKPTNTNTNANEPAYPCQEFVAPGSEFQVGLTKRELIAAMAMQGLLANAEHRYSISESIRHAVWASDALLAEIEKEKA